MSEEIGPFDDKLEWIETFELLEKGEEIIGSELSFGEFVTIKKELFDNIINEVNKSRIKNGELGEDVDLIVIGEPDEFDSED